MLIHLSESLIREGECKRYDVPFGFDTLTCQAGTYPISEAEPAALAVTNLGNQKYHLAIHIACTMQIPCARCLKDVAWPFQIDTEEDVNLKQTAQDRVDDLDEQTYIQGYHLDVDEFIRNELFLNMPMKVLCSEDCEGIGNRYGTDPATGICECEGRPLDPRMAAIQEIFNNANR
jgi:uncharacterized protein